MLWLIPFPNPNQLPKGTRVWFWRVDEGPDPRTLIASGSVMMANGITTTHAAQVIPSRRRLGIYSVIVLPELARRFGVIHSDLNLAEGARGAWRRAGGTWDGSRFVLKK